MPSPVTCLGEVAPRSWWSEERSHGVPADAGAVATYEPPQANAYVFHPDHFVELLEGLSKKFTEEANLELLLQGFTHDINQADKTIMR